MRLNENDDLWGGNSEVQRQRYAQFDDCVVGIASIYDTLYTAVAKAV